MRKWYVSDTFKPSMTSYKKVDAGEFSLLTYDQTDTARNTFEKATGKNVSDKFSN